MKGHHVWLFFYIKHMTMMKKIFLSSLLLTIVSAISQAQEHNVSAGYQKPTDPQVLQNVVTWQDLKFGLFMRWGTYSQWGIVESWSLCPEDVGWTQRKPEHGEKYYDYVKNYE